MPKSYPYDPKFSTIQILFTCKSTDLKSDYTKNLSFPDNVDIYLPVTKRTEIYEKEDLAASEYGYISRAHTTLQNKI